MHSIYGNSSCNISALNSTSPAEGLSLTKPPYAPILTNFSIDSTEISHVLRMRDTWSDFVTSSPLNLRAWVYQERLLSPRILHFLGHQLFWECGKLSASEDWPQGVPPRFAPQINLMYPKYVLIHDDHEIKRELSKLILASNRHHRMDRRESKVRWAKVVKLYTRASLTFATDRLIAISGIAAQFQPKFDGLYFAGLWKWSIVTDLLWQVEDTDGPDSTIVIDVLDVALHRVSEDEFGQLAGGNIRIQGQLATSYQNRGVIGFVGYDLDIEVAKELRTKKTDFGKHLYYLLPIRLTSHLEEDSEFPVEHVEGLVLTKTAGLSAFQRHGVFELQVNYSILGYMKRIHGLSEGHAFFDETLEARSMARIFDPEGHYRYTLDII
ncbi:hypothetical protein VTL71DRAFT_15981 [Oculimacula yallundae]|uniref:Heterokaryon incompatibility domain-containing protein n=1 Tax=Oculimacula yallundae TaxID=86028 RepID=A0ABR4CFJ7_9HELO